MRPKGACVLPSRPVALKVEDVAPSGYAIGRATIRQKKTGRAVKFELTYQTRQAIDAHLRGFTGESGTFLFQGRSTNRIAYYPPIRPPSPGVARQHHSLRRTKATLIYRRTGNLRAVQLLLGHTKIESTVRYLGIEVDDALSIAEQVEV
jgi:integrase